MKQQQQPGQARSEAGAGASFPLWPGQKVTRLSVSRQLFPPHQQRLVLVWQHSCVLLAAHAHAHAPNAQSPIRIRIRIPIAPFGVATEW